MRLRNATLWPRSALKYLNITHFALVLITRHGRVFIYSSKQMFASVFPSLSFSHEVFIELLVARAVVGEVNKMSEEMLSFIVNIMHNTPALWAKRAIVYHRA